MSTDAAAWRPGKAWMILADCTDEAHGDSWADEMAVHGPAIDAEARAAALDEARKEVQARYDDLRWCNKDDNCHDLAGGAELALSDIDALRDKP